MVVIRERPTKIIAQSADPAAGSGSVSVTLGAVTDSFVFHIKGIYVPFVTDANVASRDVLVSVTDSAGVPIFSVVQSFSASQAGAVELHRVDSSYNTGSYYVLPLPDKFIVPGGYKVDVTVSNVQAGDDLGVVTVFGTQMDEMS